jgi:hypothetical protein
MSKDEAGGNLSDLLKRLGENFKKEQEEHGEPVFAEDFEYPITINSLKIFSGISNVEKATVGAPVKVRIAGEDDTHDGFYLGELQTDTPLVAFYPKSKELRLVARRNPALFVPKLNRIVWGMESWWAFVGPGEEKKSISDADIEDTVYVKMMKAMEDRDV